MIPQRYLIATLFIAAMLLLMAVVQAPRSVRSGGVRADGPAPTLALEPLAPEAELRLEEGWAPRFVGAQDPDQLEPWPFEGGFGLPWEPASPYLADQGLALNGPGGRSEVALWRGVEWRRYRFDAPLASARLDPRKGNRLLVTLQMGPRRFETRLLEVPEGRVLWSLQSGPWSRFSWDGKAALVGFFEPGSDEAAGEGTLLLSTLPLDGEPGDATLAPWDEKGLPPAPKGVPTKAEALSNDGRDLPGLRLAVPWRAGDRLWFPARDRLWTSTAQGWACWGQEDRTWRRLDAGPGVLFGQPPLRMGLAAPTPEGTMARRLSPAAKPDWAPVPEDAAPWLVPDPAWTWLEGPDPLALTAWDDRQGAEAFPRERQRQGLVDAYRPEWRSDMALRASIPGWLPRGPEVALRELQGAAWVWVGTKALLVPLVEVERIRLLRRRVRTP